MATSNYVANFNLTSWANAQAQLNSGNPQNVTIPMMDENGNVANVTVPNRGMFQKRVWDDVGGALGQFSRTFYVDAENGDDNNDGSSDSPFKTLQRAVDKTPISGVATINLISDYTGSFNVHCKNIKIYIDKDKTWTIPKNYKCDITGSNILIENKGHLIVDRGDGDGINGNNYAGFFVTDYEHDNYLQNSTNLYLVNIRTSNPIRIDANRALFGSRTWGTNQNVQMNMGVYNIHCEDNFIADGAILYLRNGGGSFQWNNCCNDDSFKLVNSDGDDLDIKDCVSGIIKDSNGVPRNIISNIVF